MSWRDRARPIIAQVLKETKGQDEKAIRKALIDAYPFGPMEYHPYRIWRSEIRAQRGLTKPKPWKPRKKREAEAFVNEHQSGLFE